MGTYKPKVISLTKKPGQTFGFFMRVEQSEQGHLIRCLEMGGPAELAGMKDGDRILRVNGTFVDDLSHSEVVELVRNSGASVTFHILDESSYKQAKSEGINLSAPKSKVSVNGWTKDAPKPKLCYLVKSSSGFEFSLRSVKSEQGVFMTEVISGGVAHSAGVRVKDRFLEVNGENVENFTHDQVVEKIRQVGGTVMFLLIDEESDKYYQNKQTKVGSWLATTRYLPNTPRIINMTKGVDGYGFLLREEHNQSGHFIRDIDKGSPAEKAGLKEKDRVIAVDGKQVENCSHEQVVDRIRQSGDDCCLLVVDKETDQLYKLGNVSPMLFLDEIKNSTSPPSYIEAVKTSPMQPSTPVQPRMENLRPKLCKMEKSSAGYGFHLNGIQGISGQYIEDVVKGGAADKAGLENGDIVVEVNRVNVEQRDYDEVVKMIRSSGEHLEMLVASRKTYEQLKAKEVTITRQLLGEEHDDGQLASGSPTTSEEKHEKSRPETPSEPAKERTLSVSSSSSASSLDERL